MCSTLRMAQFTLNLTATLVPGLSEASLQLLSAPSHSVSHSCSDQAPGSDDTAGASPAVCHASCHVTQSCCCPYVVHCGEPGATGDRRTAGTQKTKKL